MCEVQINIRRDVLRSLCHLHSGNTDNMWIHHFHEGINIPTPFILHQSMKVKLLPPSGIELAPFNPILPPASITQIMLLANPTRVGDRIINLRTQIHSFNADGAKKSECVCVCVCVCVCLSPHRRRCVCVTSWLSHSATVCATRLERWTSSPHQRHGVSYRGTDRFMLHKVVCVCVCGHSIHPREKGGQGGEIQLHSTVQFYIPYS